MQFAHLFTPKHRQRYHQLWSKEGLSNRNEAEEFGKLLASEIYLLEKWDFTSRDNAVTQRKRIFRDYVQLGDDGRWPYHKRAKAGDYPPPTASQIESILKGIRTLQQRAVASSLVRGGERVWLRIDYGAGENPLDTVEEDFLPMALSNRAQNTSALILNDSNLYNYDDWTEILECFPDVLDSRVGPPNPERYHRCIAEEKELAENDMELYNQDEPEEIRSQAHSAWVTGLLWVHDSKTTETGEMLLLWMDQYGRVVREVRMGADDIDEISGMFHLSRDIGSPWWNKADQGQEYEGGNWR